VPAEDVPVPDSSDGPLDQYPPRRIQLVQKAVREWVAALVDLGGRNNLLHYRDLRVGTLDLTKASPSRLAALLQGRTVKASSLFEGDEEERSQAMRRLRTIHNKSKENYEERGLETLSIACGLATWENKRGGWEPSAPALLRRASLRPLGASQDDFELTLVEEMEVNPTLLHVLKVDFECDFDHEKLLDRVDGAIDEVWELEESYEWLAKQADGVPAFAVDPRIVLANFSYAKLPMVRDLENAGDELVAHDLIAAIAGDKEARDAVRLLNEVGDGVPHPDDIPPIDEFVVLDADASQHYAINAVLAGQHLIVRGPPGTGKSQTIANLITSLVARGKRVLFVAEKRAAIDAVTKRLNHKKLGDIVLDLHGGVTSRRAFAQTMGQAIANSRSAARTDNASELERLAKRRSDLNNYERALHDKREPWDISVYDIRAELLARESTKNELRFKGETLERLGADRARGVEDDLGEFASLGGVSLSSDGSPWASSPIISSEQVQQAYEAVEEFSAHTVPNALKLLRAAAAETSLAPPNTIVSWGNRIALWQDVERVGSFFTPSIYSIDLEAVCEAMTPATRGGFTRFRAGLSSSGYRAARRELRACQVGGDKVGDHELCGFATSARDVLRRWRGLSRDGTPRAPANLDGLSQLHGHVSRALSRIETFVGVEKLAERPLADVQELLDRLLADRATLVKLPDINRLSASLIAAGLAEFLSTMAKWQAPREFVVGAFRYAWLHSILDHVELRDPVIGGFDAAKQESAVDEFRRGDRQHIDATPARLRRICAERAVRAREERRDQAELVEHQSRLKRKHRPVRELVRDASDVLLALKPCWAMSPLVVSQLLPAKAYFDVVIFDEASQITPADAISAIMRGKQLVVAGDEKQLPPSSFFLAGDGDDSDESDEEEFPTDTPPPLVAGTKGFESILDALGSLVPFRMLRWHYRSRDERLIAFSNAHIYDGLLTTFPGVGGTRVLSYVAVGWDPSAESNSPTPEVNAVVDLILEHAAQRPEESLGVIAMGIKHSNRIEEALRQRLHDDADLAERLGGFFDETREERFFVKNLERVQGDERDAIILSIGYGKNERGQLVYRFGPLLMDGGERRLNVAVTRAKRRMTLVSSFAHGDMDPERSRAEGVKLLRQYLQYVESDGSNLGDRVIDKPALNPFEVDVRDTLTARGLHLVAQYGCSGFWIDFAVQHPTDRGRYVLALECDGASYHSSESARDRDRLRQDQLERLGWRFHRIWSTEWFHNKDVAVAKVLDAYEKAIQSTHLAKEEHLDHPTPRIAASGPVVEAPPATTRLGARPRVQRGLAIQFYNDTTLDQLARWIESDDGLRTEEEVLVEMMNELGFRRRGKNVVARLHAAIRRARRSK